MEAKTPSETEKVRAALAKQLDPFPFLSRADATANLLARAEARRVNRMRTAALLTGFGGLQ